MIETSEGEMWFGVDKGVIHYDGLDWTLYTPSDGLRGTPVNIMKVFDDGSIYAGSESGLSRFDGEKWHPIFPDDTSLTFSVRSICDKIPLGIPKRFLLLARRLILLYK